MNAPPPFLSFLGVGGGRPILIPPLFLPPTDPRHKPEVSFAFLRRNWWVEGVYSSSTPININSLKRGGKIPPFSGKIFFEFLF